MYAIEWRVKRGREEKVDSSTSNDGINLQSIYLLLLGFYNHLVYYTIHYYTPPHIHHHRQQQQRWISHNSRELNRLIWPRSSRRNRYVGSMVGSSVSVIGSKWWTELDGLDRTIEGDVKCLRIWRGGPKKDQEWEEMVGVEKEYTPVDSQRDRIPRHHPLIVRKISLIVKPPWGWSFLNSVIRRHPIPSTTQSYHLNVRNLLTQPRCKISCVFTLV